MRVWHRHHPLSIRVTGMWETTTGERDVTSGFLGVTTPVRDLYDEIHKRGWTVDGLDIKDGQYVAAGKNPHGESLEKTGPTDATALGNLLVAILRQETARWPAHLGTWQTTFEDQLQEVAQAYAEAKIYDPKAAVAWQELAQDSLHRAEVLSDQLRVELTDDPHPYQSINEMAEDVMKKRHILVTRAQASHPVWSVDQVVAFRLAHDVLGHIVGGGDWGWHGSNLAFAAHAPLLSENAQKALFTETLGQVAYASVYRSLGPQKIVFLDEQLEKVQQTENGPGHHGVHPSQSLAPAAIPSILEETAPQKQSRLSNQPQRRKGTTFPTSSAFDPNHAWESGIAPLPDNAFLWQRDPVSGLDPLDYSGLKEGASQLDSRWHTRDPASQQQAIANAFRATLAAPRKDLRHGAIHYQDVAHIPAAVHDPLEFWQALEESRENWNQARGYPAGGHAPFLQEFQQLKQWIRSVNPRLDDEQVAEKSKRELIHMLHDEEERLMMDDPDESMGAADLEKLAMHGVQKRLRILTKPRLDQKHDFADQGLYYEATLNLSADPYGSHLVSHLTSMAAVGKNIDRLHRAALEDMVHNHGAGHHFRATALKMKMPGVGPKQVSNAWFMLQPHTSQLAIINPHVLETLEHKPEEMNDRDYFKFERELGAGRDASGYNHLPLGLFSAGMRDYKVGGHGYHSDLSSMRSLNPVSHDLVDWQQRIEPESGWAAPYWWDETAPIREQAGKDFDRSVAVVNPADHVPYQKTAATLRVPYFVHPDDGVAYDGEAGDSIMQHIKKTLGLTTEQAWQLAEEAGKR